MDSDRPASLTKPFTEAKAGLSALMDDVVHEHRPQVIDRHRGRESMVVVPIEDLTDLYLGQHFTPLEVAFEEDAVLVTATSLSLVGEGSDLDSALDELAEAIDDFAGTYFERFGYYRHTPDRDLAPFLLRFLLTAEEKRRELLLEPLRRGEMAYDAEPAA